MAGVLGNEGRVPAPSALPHARLAPTCSRVARPPPQRQARNLTSGQSGDGENAGNSLAHRAPIMAVTGHPWGPSDSSLSKTDREHWGSWGALQFHGEAETTHLVNMLHCQWVANAVENSA